MKKEIVTLFLMTSVWAAQAQGTFTIEGQVKNGDLVGPAGRDHPTKVVQANNRQTTQLDIQVHAFQLAHKNQL